MYISHIYVGSQYECLSRKPYHPPKAVAEMRLSHSFSRVELMMINCTPMGRQEEGADDDIAARKRISSPGWELWLGTFSLGTSVWGL